MNLRQAGALPIAQTCVAAVFWSFFQGSCRAFRREKLKNWSGGLQLCDCPLLQPCERQAMDYGTAIKVHNGILTGISHGNDCFKGTYFSLFF